jgi:hypothetical protein
MEENYFVIWVRLRISSGRLGIKISLCVSFVNIRDIDMLLLYNLDKAFIIEILYGEYFQLIQLLWFLTGLKFRFLILLNAVFCDEAVCKRATNLKIVSACAHRGVNVASTATSEEASTQFVVP